MAHVSIHYTHPTETPEVSATSLPTATCLRIEVLGGDRVSMFFENDTEFMNFVDKVDQALTAYLQSKELDGVIEGGNL